MTDDLLKAAAGALREETENLQPSVDFTRARLMTSLHKTRERRRTRWVLALPIAATFAAASAFATSGHVPAIVQTVAIALGLKAKPDPLPTAKPRARVSAKAPGPSLPSTPEALTPAAPTPVVDVPAPNAPVVDVPAPNAPVVDVPAPNAPVVDVPAPSVPHAANVSSAARTAELDVAQSLYLEAHRSHFEQANYARALPAWEDYLRKAPNGRFALEARFNRAVCLIRLGRLTEAKSALAPFADGRTGGYRQHEASELLDSLGG